MKHRVNRASTDRLKRVQQLSCFETQLVTKLDDLITSESTLGEPSLHIGNPIASLVKCDNQIFLALGQVIQICFAGQSDLIELAVEHLNDTTASLSFQIYCLLQETMDDDPEGKHNWCWFQTMEATCCDVPASIVQPLNPTISTTIPGAPKFLFNSTFLVMLAATLRQELTKEAFCKIPDVSCSPFFPYRYLGKACFICEDFNSGHSPGDGDTSDAACTSCGNSAHIDRTSAKQVLEHMGAHILHDPSISQVQEVCGLCLRPAPICQIFVKKGRGNSQGYKVDADRSTCTNLLRFKYASAAQHQNNSPCTNVPLPCPICPPKSPAVWKYCLPVHFEQKHKLTVQNFPIKLDISMEEMDGMAKIWENRHRK